MDTDEAYGSFQIELDAESHTVHTVIFVWLIWKFSPQYSEISFEPPKLVDDGDVATPASFSKLSSIGSITSIPFAIGIADSESVK